MTSMGFFLLMFLAGAAVAVQPSINSRLAQRVGALESSAISFAVGTIALLLLVCLSGRMSFKEIGGAHWWELTGGLLGAFFVTMTIIVVPRIGTTSAMAATICAQLISGLLLDHFGLFGFRTVPLDGKRMLGALLLLVGASLAFRR